MSRLQIKTLFPDEGVVPLKRKENKWLGVDQLAEEIKWWPQNR